MPAEIFFRQDVVLVALAFLAGLLWSRDTRNRFSHAAFFAMWPLLAMLLAVIYEGWTYNRWALGSFFLFAAGVSFGSRKGEDGPDDVPIAVLLRRPLGWISSAVAAAAYAAAGIIVALNYRWWLTLALVVAVAVAGIAVNYAGPSLLPVLRRRLEASPSPVAAGQPPAAHDSPAEGLASAALEERRIRLIEIPQSAVPRGDQDPSVGTSTVQDMVEVKCPGCDHRSAFPMMMNGLNVKCLQCGTVMEVGRGSYASRPSPKHPKRSASGGKPDGPSRVRRPRPRSEKGAGPK